MTNVATIEKTPDGKFVAMFNGKRIAKSGSKDYVMQSITSGLNTKAKELGISTYMDLTGTSNSAPSIISEAANPAKPAIYFSINERFEFLGTLARMVIHEAAPSLLVTGPGGYGKTFSVTKEITEAGLTFTTDFPDVEESEPDEEDDGEAEPKEPQEAADVHIVKGFSTAKGLYRTLYENNGKLIIFDDCDSVFRDKNAVNILKGALDSYEERWVSWNAEARPGDRNPLPKKFLFTGRIIFISNLNQSQVDGAIKSRCLRVDLNMTTPEKIERMHTIVESGYFMKDSGISIEKQRQAVNFLDEHKYDATELSMRTLISVTKILVEAETNGATDWKRLALYNITAG